MDGRAMGFLGRPAASTPNLDRLAERGTAFTETYCTSPQCVPSRASFMSGRYAHEIEAWNNSKGLEHDDTTILDDAKAAGYRTAEIGRQDYRSGSHSRFARMTAWVRAADLELPEKDPPVTDLVEEGVRQRTRDWNAVDEALEELDSLAETDDPFHLKLGTSNPHPGGGYRTTPEHLQHVPADEVTLPPTDPLEHPVVRKASVSKNTHGETSDERIREIRRYYLGMIRETDAMVGEVLDALDEQGLSEDTVVIFCSDHGDMQLEHGQWLKNSMYEATARVPFIAAGPGIASGHRVETPVSLIDLRDTIADVCGYEPLAETSGRSLEAGLAGHDVVPEPVFAEYHSNMQCTGSFMLRHGRWKYVAYGGYEPQLFDVEADPAELENLTAERPAVVERMDALLREFCDYPSVDRRAKADDRESLRAYRFGADEEEYLALLHECFEGVTEEHERRVEEWLSGDAEPSWNPPEGPTVDR